MKTQHHAACVCEFPHPPVTVLAPTSPQSTSMGQNMMLATPISAECMDIHLGSSTISFKA
jgi:hypothetical protein